MNDVLITGGTGSLGQELVRQLILDKDQRNPGRIIVFSRDEHKQEAMKAKFNSPKLRFFIGDVRDMERVRLALWGVSHIIHTAALKIVPSGEYNPSEYVNTNIIGSQNVFRAAFEQGVKRVIAVSTDKAVRPVNLYGATKLVMERLAIAANNMLPFTDFNVVRYGNVANSNGSVIPVFKRHCEEGVPLPVTHVDMTRYWIELHEAAEFVINCLYSGTRGKVLIPAMPSFKVLDLAHAFTTDTTIIGVRNGEKLHEEIEDGRSSNENDRWLTVKDLHEKLVSMEVLKTPGEK